MAILICRVVIQVLCSYVTLPLYALVTQVSLATKSIHAYIFFPFTKLKNHPLISLCFADGFNHEAYHLQSESGISTEELAQHCQKASQKQQAKHTILKQAINPNIWYVSNASVAKTPCW